MNKITFLKLATLTLLATSNTLSAGEFTSTIEDESNVCSEYVDYARIKKDQEVLMVSIADNNIGVIAKDMYALARTLNKESKVLLSEFSLCNAGVQTRPLEIILSDMESLDATKILIEELRDEEYR